MVEYDVQNLLNQFNISWSLGTSSLNQVLIIIIKSTQSLSKFSFRLIKCSNCFSLRTFTISESEQTSSSNTRSFSTVLLLLEVTSVPER